MAELNPPTNPYIQMLAGMSPGRHPLYCPGPPTPRFCKRYRETQKINTPPVYIGEDDFHVPKLLGFDAISLWMFRSPQKPPISLGHETLIDAWGRKKHGKWYLNEGVLTSEQAWDEWIATGFFTYPPDQEFISLSSLLRQLTQGPLAGMAFDASLAGAFEKMWQGMGFLRFARALRRNERNFIGLALDHLLAFSMGIAQRWVKFTGIKNFIITDDMAYKGRPLISPQDWATLLLPRYTNFTNKIHDMGGHVILHSDGQVEPLIPLFIQAGFDAIQGLEPAAGVDIFHVMKQYKNKIMLIGNLDVSYLLVYSQPSDVRRETEKILDHARKMNTRIAISTSQQIDESCKPENIIAMCQMTRNSNI